MSTPTYVSATNYLKGVSAAEGAINISGYKQAWNDEKTYIENKGGTKTGFVHNYDISTTATITGETNAATLDIVMGVAFGVAETVANSISGYGVTAGGFYLEDIEIDQQRGSLCAATANLIKHPDIT